VTQPDKVTLAAYSFNHPRVTELLSAAAATGAEVEMYVDYAQTMTGTTWQQPEKLNALHEAGVSVNLVSGRNAKGIQHGKFLLINHLLIVGSTNWTQGSSNNHELSVLLSLDDYGKESILRHLIGMITISPARVHSFSQQFFEEATANRRRRSSSQPTRGSRSEMMYPGPPRLAGDLATARRYSIAQRGRAAASNAPPQC